MRKNSNLAMSLFDAIASPNERLNSFLGFGFSIALPVFFASVEPPG